MAAVNLDFRDFYVKSPDNKNYDPSLIEEDDIIQTIIQRYELLIFSNKGDLVGDPNFGPSLQDLLFNSNVPSTFIVDLLKIQITEYLPELDIIGYDLKAEFVQDLRLEQDYLITYLSFKDYEVYAQIGNVNGII